MDQKGFVNPHVFFDCVFKVLQSNITFQILKTHPLTDAHMLTEVHVD
jgi:hypothetical protein